jgi:hypothetical protein
MSRATEMDLAQDTIFSFAFHGGAGVIQRGSLDTNEYYESLAAVCRKTYAFAEENLANDSIHAVDVAEFAVMLLEGEHCCTVVLLHCCTAALLHCCTVALLHCCELHCCTSNVCTVTVALFSNQALPPHSCPFAHQTTRGTMLARGRSTLPRRRTRWRPRLCAETP